MTASACATSATCRLCSWLFSGREPGDRPVALAPAGVAVVIAAEADDTIAPHARGFPSHVAHELHDCTAVLPLLRIRDAYQKLLDVLIGWPGLEVAHLLLLI